MRNPIFCQPLGLLWRMCEMTKTAGQIAYEHDVARRPTYPDGSPRKAWKDLPGYAQWSWERTPESDASASLSR